MASKKAQTWGNDGHCTKHVIPCPVAHCVPGSTVLMPSEPGGVWLLAFVSPEAAKAFVKASNAEGKATYEQLLKAHGEQVAKHSLWRQRYTVWQG